ncbi:hypothetical protein C2I18_21615 [Paenibacillus sp. PK3_47]|nr:hypothetical protein C2I18_21615 [Paenibacillus sp. PK3_47]
MKPLKTAILAVLCVSLVVGLHLILICFLDIRVEGRDTEFIKEISKVYFLPLLLCFINCYMCIETKRVKYHVTWFLVSTIPSGLLLLFIKGIQNTGEEEVRGFVTIEFFPRYLLEMLYLLPGSIGITQFILLIYYLITLRKK